MLPNDCALGLAMKTYLEELLTSQPVQAEHKKAALETMRKYFPYASDFAGDLKTAFAIWDAVSDLRCTPQSHRAGGREQ